MLAYAKDNGIDLTDDEMDSIAGGYDSGKKRACPYCGSTDIHKGAEKNYQCNGCGKTFERVDAKMVAE